MGACVDLARRSGEVPIQIQIQPAEAIQIQIHGRRRPPDPDLAIAWIVPARPYLAATLTIARGQPAPQRMVAFALRAVALLVLAPVCHATCDTDASAWLTGAGDVCGITVTASTTEDLVQYVKDFAKCPQNPRLLMGKCALGFAAWPAATGGAARYAPYGGPPGPPVGPPPAGRAGSPAHHAAGPLGGAKGGGAKGGKPPRVVGPGQVRAPLVGWQGPVLGPPQPSREPLRLRVPLPPLASLPGEEA